MSQVKPVPTGMHTITPHLVCRSAAKAIEFYTQAFGAREAEGRMTGPDGGIMHSRVHIGDSVLMIVDESPKWKCLSPLSLNGSPVTLHLYVPNVDEVVAKAVAAGATLTMPVMDMFWGDRYGKLVDPYGHEWSVATKIRDVSPAEMEAAAKAMFAKMK